MTPDQLWPAHLPSWPLPLQTDFWHASRLRAKAIAELARAKGELTLLLSGGLQSEWMAHSFRAERIPFSARILNLSGRNAFDVTGAIRLCERLQIPFTEKNWDLVEFARREGPTLAEKLRIQDRALILAVKMLQDPEVYLVRAGGLPSVGVVDRSLTILNWPQWMQELTFGRLNSARGTLAFFSADDILIQSYLSDSRLQKWNQLRVPMGFADTREWREIVFRAYCPDIKSRPSWTGFEAFAASP